MYKILLGEDELSRIKLWKEVINSKENFQLMAVFSTTDQIVSYRGEVDIIVMKFALTPFDGLYASKIIRKVKKNKNTKIILITPFSNKILLKLCKDVDINYIWTREYDVFAIADKINELLEPPKEQILTKSDDVFNLEVVISKEIDSLGISKRLKGYAYLREFIIKLYTNDVTVNKDKRKLVLELANKFNTTVDSIDRNMRTAIKYAWKKDLSYQKEFYNGEDTPSVKILTMIIVKRVREQQQQYINKKLKA